MTGTPFNGRYPAMGACFETLHRRPIIGQDIKNVEFIRIEIVVILCIRRRRDRKSTRLNSSHQIISYAVFCLKSKEHTSELQSPDHLVCRLLLEKKRAQVCTPFTRSIIIPASY